MVKSIMKDIFFLNQKSELATKADVQVIQDLLDTLKANKEGCVGMAANMIGVKKRIIVISMGDMNVPMINPVIVNKSGQYETEEGCLSLIGVRKTKTFKEIEVEYFDSEFKKRRGKYSGWIAQIIQHEVDHCDGIII
ncbi:peptide deformylase [Clostridium estertheticum]|uniref:peptide deformylase n=1 Tax=Clostridium estertheticum TaxID=238834 RepID=UPI001C6EEC60|nr:peptide deformylase [Clostridium estertheticum]MBW9171240.1 peptide deformylase [Clostridium estertheticum]WLC73905.1 peptide deformylase [Clostridium estertheticum]